MMVYPYKKIPIQKYLHTVSLQTKCNSTHGSCFQKYEVENIMGKEEYADYQHVSCFRDVFKSVVCRGKYMRGCWDRKELIKK